MKLREIFLNVLLRITGIASAAYWDITSPCGPWPSKTPNSQLKGLVASGKDLITLNES